MTAGVLLAHLRAIGARYTRERGLVLPPGLNEADQVYLSALVKLHERAVIASFSRPEPSAEVAAMLAEVEQLGGLPAADLIEDARAGRIRPDDLWKWVRDWHHKRSLMRAVEDRGEPVAIGPACPDVIARRHDSTAAARRLLPAPVRQHRSQVVSRNLCHCPQHGVPMQPDLSILSVTEQPDPIDTGSPSSQPPPSSTEVRPPEGDLAPDYEMCDPKWYRDCPRCRRNDGVLDAGPVCLSFCDSCKTFWFAGRNHYHGYYPSWDRTWADLEKTDHVLDAYEFVMGLTAGAAQQMPVVPR